MRPVRRVRHETMLDRVEMRIVHVSRKVAIVADRVLPVPPLPNAAFAAACHDRWSRLADRQRFRESVLIARDRPGKSASPCGNVHGTVHVVGQDDPGVDVKRCARALGEPHRAARRCSPPTGSSADPAGFAVKKKGPAWNPIAAIIRHLRSMHGRGERRNALRCSAIRLPLKALAQGLNCRLR